MGTLLQAGLYLKNDKHPYHPRNERELRILFSDEFKKMGKREKRKVLNKLIELIEQEIEG